MARSRKVEVGALNVRLHPHDDGTYESFIRAIYKLRQPIKMRGDRKGVISSLSARNEEGLIEGTITTYLDIDMNQSWFNENTFGDATEADLNQIVLPNYLHPNLKSFLFSLDTSKHRIYFERYTGGNVLSPKSALHFFRASADHPAISEEFGDAKITIVQSQFGLSSVFSLNRITNVKIHIEKPNDIWPDSFEKSLADKNARSVTIDYKAERGLGIVKDAEITNLADESLENGYTEVSGYGSDGHKVLSTKDFPRLEQDRFDPDDYTAVSMFRRVSERFRRRG